MTAPAVLWIRAIAPGVIEYVLDCAHATTTGRGPSTVPPFEQPTGASARQVGGS